MLLTRKAEERTEWAETYYRLYHGLETITLQVSAPKTSEEDVQATYLQQNYPNKYAALKNDQCTNLCSDKKLILLHIYMAHTHGLLLGKSDFGLPTCWHDVVC